MVTISNALQAAQVIDYHKQDYASTQANYYSKGDQIPGQWHGKLARELGLQGPVSTEHFSRLAQGQNPHTGQQLVRHRIATTGSAEHRAGWDATFSPPKSVSITALVGRDKAILEAHRAAVREVIDFLERHTNARIGGNHPSEQTGKWVAATFEHDSARPVDGFAAPQLHTHVVFFNVAKTGDGKFHALQERPIFRQQNLATTIYQSRLAHELYRLGYDLEQGKNHSPEIKGYTPEYLEANSGRSATINEGMKELEKKGIHGAEARHILAHSTRQSKGTAHRPGLMRQLNKDLAAKHGDQHAPVLKAALAQRYARQQALTPDQAHTAAQQAVRYASDRGFEREAVVTKSMLLRDALHRGMGTTTFQEVESAFNARTQTGALILAAHKSGPAYTTPAMLALEKQNIQLVLDGQVKHPPIIAPDRIHEDKLSYLRAQQHTAALGILTSRDRVQGLQGAAGTGKTTTLRIIREELEQHGYRVQGYAPTSRAAHNLAEAGIETTTLQYRLARGPDPSPTPTVHFLDESSLASTQQISDFLNKLPAQDRAVLVGDLRQHESVEAGRVFAQLQENGMQTSQLSQIQRQKDPQLKQIVQLLSEGRAKEAFQGMNEQGRIREIADPNERYTAITKDYLSDPENSLVLTTDNRSRKELNQTIHEALRGKGRLTGQDRSVDILITRQSFTGADKSWAGAYNANDTIRFTTGSRKFGIAPREYVTVTAINAQDNTVTICKKDGNSITYNPNYNHGVTVYQGSQARFAAGDRIQFTQPFQEYKIANCDFGTIASIGADKDPSLTVNMDSGRQVSFIPEQFPHIDYGYTVTSYSAQSLTTKNVISNLDTSVNSHLIHERMAYVMASRAEWVARVYTDNKQRLEPLFSQDVSKTSAIQCINALNQAPAITQSPITRELMNIHKHDHTPQPIQTDAPKLAITPAQQPARNTTPIQAAEPTSQVRPITSIDRPVSTPQRGAELRARELRHTDQRLSTRHEPARPISARTIPQPKSTTPERLTGAESRFVDRLERIQPADVERFLQLSHEEREIRIGHSQALERMSPEQAAHFVDLSTPERSKYLLQHIDLTQPSDANSRSEDISKQSSIDRGCISY